jgi:predicted GNAT superfamily acetyltransferase
VHRAQWDAGPFPVPGDLHLDPSNAQVVAFEIPADYQAIKATDPALALHWRLTAREVFQTYFARGYVVAGFDSFERKGRRRSIYSMRRWQELKAGLRA